MSRQPSYATLAAASALLLAACGPQQPAVKADDGGRIVALLAEQKLTGKVVLVEFGTVGCPLSDSCLGVMTAWHKAGTIPGLSFLRLEAAADQGAFDSYYQGRSVPFPVVRDPKSEIGTALGTTVFPSFALIDKFGRVRYRGKLPAAEMAASTEQGGRRTSHRVSLAAGLAQSRQLDWRRESSRIVASNEGNGGRRLGYTGSTVERLRFRNSA